MSRTEHERHNVRNSKQKSLGEAADLFAPVAQVGQLGVGGHDECRLSAPGLRMRVGGRPVPVDSPQPDGGWRYSAGHARPTALCGRKRGPLAGAPSGCLARKGAKVAIGDLDGDAAAKTAADIPGAFGLRLDVSDPGSYRAFLDEVAARLGPSDVLVANAGVMWVGSFDDEPVSATKRQLAVNVEGVIYGIRAAVPDMRARGKGQVIVVASAASRLAAEEAVRVRTAHRDQARAAAPASRDTPPQSLNGPRKWAYDRRHHDV